MSSSDTRLSSCLILILSRLKLLCMPYIALRGRCGAFKGEAGGEEVAISPMADIAGDQNVALVPLDLLLGCFQGLSNIIRCAYRHWLRC